MPELVPAAIIPPFEPSEHEDRYIWDEHVNAWQEAATEVQTGLFKLGAIAASVTTRYGERDVMRFAHEVKVSTALIYERASTYRQIEAKAVKLRPALPYTHHKLAAATDEPNVWLDRAEDEGWSSRQLEAAIRGKPYTPHEPEPYPLPQVEPHRRLEFWLGHIRSLPCLRCDKRGETEAAHIKSVYSDKTGERQTRRGSITMYSCLPLCRGCHREARDSLHSVGEAQFLEQFGGYEWALAWMFTEMVQVMERWE